jgi:hypothetical protein
MSIEAMKQALEALSYVMSHGVAVRQAKDILTAAIEQAEKREWQGLTDEDIYSIIENNVPPKLTSLFEMAGWVTKVVEARLKEKNS